MVIISLELTRVNPDRNIFSINVKLKSTVLFYRGLVHHHHRILNLHNNFTGYWRLQKPYRYPKYFMKRIKTLPNSALNLTLFSTLINIPIYFLSTLQHEIFRLTNLPVYMLNIGEKYNINTSYKISSIFQ